MKGIDPGDLQLEIEKILRDYGELVYQATEKGLGAAQSVLIKNLKSASPKDAGEFSKSWKAKRYKLMRFVGNTKKVTNKKGDEIPLSNILEYSPVRGKPFIKRTYENSMKEMADAIISEIKKEV